MSKIHFCLVKHDPEAGLYGDCLRACIASLLNIEETTDVPHFMHDGCDGNVAQERLKEWLKGRGLAPFYMLFNEDGLAEVLHVMKLLNPGVRYILMGATEEEEHAIVYAGDELINDPAWCHSPLVGPSLSNGYWTVLIVVPLAVVQ